jgi:hypothetical protein
MVRYGVILHEGTPGLYRSRLYISSTLLHSAPEIEKTADFPSLFVNYVLILERTVDALLLD